MIQCTSATVCIKQAATAGAMLVMLAGCTPVRHYEAMLVLQDLAAADTASRLKETTPEPKRKLVSYAVAGRSHNADLYLPDELEGCKANSRCPRAAIVVVPGAVPQGKDDPRIVAFAATLARAGFAVLAPEIKGFRELQIHPSDIRTVADAFFWLSSSRELAPGGRTGMFAFSYSAGPALLAALEDDIREQVRFIVAVGGYHDLQRAMRFFTTGWFEHEGKWHYITPDDTGKMVLAYASLPYLADKRDHAVFDRMVTLRMHDPNADLVPLAGELSAEGKSIYDLAVNDDPARFSELFERLPGAMRKSITLLDLAQHDLKPLKAQLMLVHGMNDNLIPYPESLSLAASVPKGQARVFLIHRILGHVDLRLRDFLSWRFWTEDIPDLWRLWRAADLLLAQREEAP